MRIHREIATALAVPGWTARSRRRSLAIVLLVVGVVVPLVPVVYAVITSRNRVALTLDARFLDAVIVGLCAAVVARVVALVEVWVATGRRTTFDRLETGALAFAVIVLVAGGVAVIQVGQARAAIASTFTPVADGALFDAARPLARDRPPSPPTTTTGPSAAPTTTRPTIETSDVPVRIATTTTQPDGPLRPDSGLSAIDLADVTTVLLLGGDAGPGRSGLRTDSMMLFSLHRPSGRASLVSIPRDLERLLFPPGSAMEAQYPDGYDGIANAVYPTVSSRQDLRDAYDVGDVRPGVVALAQGLGYSLDVTIDDYVLIDMQGFIDVIDALGGVSVDVPKAIPMPGNVPGARTRYPDVIGPGLVAMDGSTALGYARSRKGDSDYYRVGRQRDLLAALARQISLTDVAISFPSVADAIGGTLRTSLTPDELADTINVIGGETAIVESVGLVPPLVDVRRPDYDEMAKIAGAVRRALVTGVASGY